MNTGHDKQKKILEQMLQKKSMNHHAFIFTGPEYIGKYKIANQFVKSLSEGEDNCDWQEINQRVDSDITIIESLTEEKNGKVKQKNISVSQIREAVRIFHLSADKKAKIIIIKNAHKMTVGAQNALLKTLEEPPENAFLILTTSEISNLLETIVSRCFKISFNLLEKEELQRISNDEELIDNAMGRPELLQKIIADSEFSDWIKYSVEQLQGLAKSSMGEKIDLAEALSKKNKSDLDIFLQVWIWRIRKAAHKTKQYNLLKFASRVENVFHELHLNNVNTRLLLEDLFLNV
ncbi:MAG: hypothetical protein KAT32_03720 [Candidatus Moranbacteria bacterium]|nr:hypothetical protein [Candidatus Moranbacteria bacterium]